MEAFEIQPLKVYFNAFWPGFEKDDNGQDYFLQILQEVYERPIKKGTLEDSDILIESVFGNDSKTNTKKWKHRYLYSCEAYLRSNSSEYDVILSGQGTGDPKQNVACPCYRLFLHANPNIKIEIPQKAPPMPQKDVICIISNPNGETRNAFLKELDKHFKVDYGGKYKNNIGGPITYEFSSKEFSDLISKYKFVICMENNKQDAYITEKILHGIRANNVPVYWGGTSVESYINPKRFINLKDTNDIPRVIGEMKRLAGNESEWQEMVQQPWETDTQPTTQLLAHHIRKLIQI